MSLFQKTKQETEQAKLKELEAEALGNPEVLHKIRLSREHSGAKDSPTVASWYCLEPTQQNGVSTGKLKLKTRKENGNVFSTFVGMSHHMPEFVEKLRAEKKLYGPDYDGV